MSAKVMPFRSKKDFLDQEQGQSLRQMVLELPGLPEDAVGKIVAAIDRQTYALTKWTFVMLSPQQNALVVNWIMHNSQRPLVAAMLWAELFMHLRTDTGEIMLTRAELAEKVGCRDRHISEIMTELESIRAVARKRDGKRVRYFMSPLVGTKIGSPVAREAAQEATPPLLVIMEGGKAKTAPQAAV